MADYNNEKKSEPGWKEKLKYYAKIGLLVIVAIWLFNLANSANNLATENAKLIQVPEYNIYHVAGGPERFSSEFEDAVEEVTEEITNGYLWSSIIVENRGSEDDEDVEINIKTAIAVEKVFVDAPGYYNDAEVEHEQGSKEVTVNIDEFDNNDQTTIFIGMLPEDYEKPLNQKKWVKEYQTYLEEVTVDSSKTEARLYAPGYEALYNNQ